MAAGEIDLLGMENARRAIDGELRHPQETCISSAMRTFRQRKSTDTNPVIVRMVWRGEPVNHWYYRSEEWVDQLFFDMVRLIQPYIGEAKLAMPFLYGEGTYVVDQKMTKLAHQL